MPATGEYTWEENDGELRVQVPLKRTSIKALDVFMAETILKVSFPPFLIDLDLADVVVEPESRAILRDGTLHLVLSKKEKRIWGDLLYNSLDKEEARRRRQRALDKRQERMEELHEKTKDKRVEEERMTLRKQMALESNERQRIETLKGDEKRDAEKQMYKALERLEVARSNEEKKSRSSSVPQSVLPKEKSSDTLADQPTSQRERQPLESVNIVASGGDTEPKDRQDYTSSNLAYIPPPRATSRATVKYTPRLFKTPRRESTKRQEKDFIAKNRPYLRNNKLLNREALDIGERDPVWLKSKGDDLYRGGDYPSAINAYSSAFELDGTMVQVLSNRAACYLQMGESARCITDCEAVLAAEGDIRLHLGEGEAADVFKTKIHIRLGTAMCQMREFDAATEAFQKASTLTPCDISLQSELERIKKWNKASALKTEGDKSAIGGNPKRAIELYNDAVNVDSSFVAAVSNRAACHLANGDAARCLEDCNAALDLLVDRQVTGSQEDDGSELVRFWCALVPAPGSQKRRISVITTLSRRAAAKVELSDKLGALRDLQEAHKHVQDGDATTREELESGIAKIKSLVEDELNWGASNKME